MDTNDESIPTRRSLLSRIRDWNDQPSWQDFYNTYWKLIYNTALGAGLNHLEAEEVAQETLISISKSIRSFHYDPERGSFKGWLRTTTTWRIRDHLRAQQREHTQFVGTLSDQTGLVGTIDDPITRNWDLDWEKYLADAAMDRVKRKVPPKHFQIFDLAAVKQWPTAKIAKALHVNAAYVYLVKHRVSARLRSELKKLKRDPCEADDLAELHDAASWVRTPHALEACPAKTRTNIRKPT